MQAASDPSPRVETRRKVTVIPASLKTPTSGCFGTHSGRPTSMILSEPRLAFIPDRKQDKQAARCGCFSAVVAEGGMCRDGRWMLSYDEAARCRQGHACLLDARGCLAREQSQSVSAKTS
ncbi:hypothetical protein L1887_57056 [Cichorium endivia]|nr:hypothetical protein L1887_57056 [Cichorium endivia]